MLHRLAENVPHRIGGLYAHDLVYWAIGAVLLIYAVIAVTLLGALVHALISWQQTEKDRVPPIVPAPPARAQETVPMPPKGESSQ